MTITPDRIAPAHVYHPKLQTGIEWRPKIVRLWDRGEVILETAHKTTSAHHFWYDLAFVECFPEIGHWWFRSAWTQRVRLTKAQGKLSADTVWGYMQFVDAQQPGQMWTVTEGDIPIIDTPYPPHETQPVNLPLRLALANLVSGTLTDEVVPDRWMLITSLVERDQLDLTFPVTRNGLPFRLQGVATSLREALCGLQGIQVPQQTISMNENR
jgi:hypothetical protein